MDCWFHLFSYTVTDINNDHHIRYCSASGCLSSDFLNICSDNYDNDDQVTAEYYKILPCAHIQYNLWAL